MEDGRECALVEVDPPVIGQTFGLGKDLVNLILTPRWKGITLQQTIDHMIPVLIYRILTPTATTQTIIHPSDIKLSAWGEVYPTLEAAEHAASNSKRFFDAG